jgi:hypothetical protein
MAPCGSRHPRFGGVHFCCGDRAVGGVLDRHGCPVRHGGSSLYTREPGAVQNDQSRPRNLLCRFQRQPRSRGASVLGRDAASRGGRPEESPCHLYLRPLLGIFGNRTPLRRRPLDAGSNNFQSPDVDLQSPVAWSDAHLASRNASAARCPAPRQRHKSSPIGASLGDRALERLALHLREWRDLCARG